MRRRVHIQFHSKYSVTLTNYLRQKKFDLIKLNGRSIDLVTFDVMDDVDYNKTRFFASCEDGEMFIYSYDGQRTNTVGFAWCGNIKHLYANPSNNTYNNSTEAVFEVTIK